LVERKTMLEHYDLDQFCENIDELHDRCGGERRLATSNGGPEWLERGV